MSGLFSKPKAPATPDYGALAERQGEENRESALQTAQLGSPNEVTPWGSINRQYDENSGQFTYTTSLTPEQQQLFEGNQDIDLSRMELGQTQIGNLSDIWKQPFSTEGMTDRVTSVNRGEFNPLDYQINPGEAPDYQKVLDMDLSQRDRVEDALYQRHSSRMEPEWQQREQQLKDRLYSQGIREGHPGWTQAFDDFNRQRTGAFEDASLSSIAGGGDEQSRQIQIALASGNFANAVTQLERQYGIDRQSAVNMATQMQNSMGVTEQSMDFDQQMQEALLANRSRGEEIDEAAYLRSLPFNEFQAMMSGTEVTPPNFSGPTVAPGVTGAPIYQAGQDQYTAAYNNYAQEMQRLNSLWSSIGNVGGQALGAWMGGMGG